METKRKIALVIIIIAVALAIIIVQNTPLWHRIIGKNDMVVFRMNGNASKGAFYKYELSRDDILREVDHYSARHTFSCVPGYSEVWEFEIVGEGELTVSWTGYEGGVINEDMSFYETYLIKGGKRTKTFDSRRAA